MNATGALPSASAYTARDDRLRHTGARHAAARTHRVRATGATPASDFLRLPTPP